MSGAGILPVVLTRDEAPNIARCLGRLGWARRVVVLDSGSTDDTASIARGFANVDFQVRAFDTHAGQCNHALDALAGDAEWLLFLDADYMLTPALVEELAGFAPPAGVAGYRARFRYCMDGVPLRGALYPPRIVLFRRGAGRFVQRGHAQALRIDGELRDLSGPIEHDDRKPAAAFRERQRKYARMEAAWLAAAAWTSLPPAARLRRLLFAMPVLAPAYALLLRGAVLDGRPGLRYAWERAQAEWFIALELARRYLSTPR